jgi:hypothetical protein
MADYCPGPQPFESAIHHMRMQLIHQTLLPIVAVHIESHTTHPSVDQL